MIFRASMYPHSEDGLNGLVYASRACFCRDLFATSTCRAPSLFLFVNNCLLFSCSRICTQLPRYVPLRHHSSPIVRTEADLAFQINSGPSPYEGEDDFFSRSQDDSALGKRTPSASYDAAGRPRGQSESVVSQS